MYLHHSFVESSERKNVYDGIAELDHNGECTVQLPDWFEAINEECRYQLTPIGAPSPDLHVAQEVTDNQFGIAGGKPGAKISWQVTGTRRDPWARANPMVVAEVKDEHDTGFYVHPELYGQPRESRTSWRGNSEALRQLEESRAQSSRPDVDRTRHQVQAIKERSASGYQE
jgi:hypothetical protein